MEDIKGQFFRRLSLEDGFLPLSSVLVSSPLDAPVAASKAS
jgi:hypothetical protein